MRFVDQFKKIINHPVVQDEARFILNHGENKYPFINYFGVNYNNHDVVSVKLYFSFFQFPSTAVFDRFNIGDKELNLIKEKWQPSNTYSYMHQGLTFGLKCYLKNDMVEINRYFHFRTKINSQKFPELIKLTDMESENFPGFCVEYHNNKIEYKNYFYYSSPKNIQKLLTEFGVKNDDSSKISLIEYTESDQEKKINIIYDRSDDVSKYLSNSGNKNISDLNKYFFDNYKLYFFGPGLRYNSPVNAIYYVSKNTYYNLFEEQTLQHLIK